MDHQERMAFLRALMVPVTASCSGIAVPKVANTNIHSLIEVTLASGDLKIKATPDIHVYA